mgnify:CR=1 FL=1
MLHKLRSVQILIWLFLLFLPHASVYGADSTSFDPTKVAVEAKSSGGVPVGTIISWPVATNPEDMDNWLECNGQSISQSVYPELFALIGGQTPDLRGLFLRGHGGNSAALGVQQNDAIRNITGSFGQHSSASAGGVFYRTGGCAEDIRSSYGTWSGNGVGFDLSRVVPTAEENRPVNQAIRYLVRARP